ncbi:hypothetical protein ACFO9E_25670 [Streptomyces maoxianensis]|uniref:Uncharacterized protein n=1 Tax=Streptomyces maoxianensis TaxID=1459942 RepID=A0ABV9GF05_9ACTN
MILIYEPQGGERRTWNLKEIRFMSSEAETVERSTGLEWQEAKARVVKGSMLALRAIVWVLVKRDEPSLRYTQFDPAETEIGVDFDTEEWAVVRDEIANSPDMDDEQRAAALAQIDAEAAGAEATEPETDDIPKDSAAEASPTAA